MLSRLSLPEKLAKAAYGRANLQKGMETALACGDWKWVRDNADAEKLYNETITSLKSIATPAQLAEAKNLTNALI
jgi:hypothetical protein